MEDGLQRIQEPSDLVEFRTSLVKIKFETALDVDDLLGFLAIPLVL